MIKKSLGLVIFFVLQISLFLSCTSEYKLSFDYDGITQIEFFKLDTTNIQSNNILIGKVTDKNLIKYFIENYVNTSEYFFGKSPIFYSAIFNIEGKEYKIGFAGDILKFDGRTYKLRKDIADIFLELKLPQFQK